MAHLSTAPRHVALHASDALDDGHAKAVRTPGSVVQERRPMSRSRGAKVVSLLLALVLALAGVLTSARSAAAHAQLVSSDPADGSVLLEMPQRVIFEFNEDINPSFAQIVVMGADQRTHAIDEVTVEGPTVGAAIPTALLDSRGQVVARYRVVSADGHPVAGEITFTVTEASAGAGTAAQTDPQSAGQQQNDATGQVPNTDEAADIEAAPSSQQAPNVAPYALMGLAAVLMVAFGAFLLVAERRKR